MGLLDMMGKFGAKAEPKGGLSQIISLLGVAASGKALLQDIVDMAGGNKKSKVIIPPPPRMPDFSSRFEELMSTQTSTHKNNESIIDSMKAKSESIPQRGDLSNVIQSKDKNSLNNLESKIENPDSSNIVNEINTNTFNNMSVIKSDIDNKMDSVLQAINLNNNIDNQVDSVVINDLSQLKSNDAAIVQSIDGLVAKGTEDTSYTTNVLSERMDYNNALTMNQILTLQSIMAGGKDSIDVKTKGFLKGLPGLIKGAIQPFLNGQKAKELRQTVLDKAAELGRITGLIVTAVELIKDIFGPQIKKLWDGIGDWFNDIKLKFQLALNKIPIAGFDKIDFFGGSVKSADEFNLRIGEASTIIKKGTANKFSNELSILKLLAKKNNYHFLTEQFNIETLNTKKILPDDISGFLGPYAEARSVNSNRESSFNSAIGDGDGWNKLIKAEKAYQDAMKSRKVNKVTSSIDNDIESTYNKLRGQPENSGLSEEELRKKAKSIVLTDKKITITGDTKEERDKSYRDQISAIAEKELNNEINPFSEDSNYKNLKEMITGDETKGNKYLLSNNQVSSIKADEAETLAEEAKHLRATAVDDKGKELAEVGKAATQYKTALSADMAVNNNINLDDGRSQRVTTETGQVLGIINWKEGPVYDEKTGIVLSGKYTIGNSREVKDYRFDIMGDKTTYIRNPIHPNSKPMTLTEFSQLALSADGSDTIKSLHKAKTSHRIIANNKDPAPGMDDYTIDGQKSSKELIGATYRDLLSSSGGDKELSKTSKSTTTSTSPTTSSKSDTKSKAPTKSKNKYAQAKDLIDSVVPTENFKYTDSNGVEHQAKNAVEYNSAINAQAMTLAGQDNSPLSPENMRQLMDSIEDLKTQDNPEYRKESEELIISAVGKGNDILNKLISQKLSTLNGNIEGVIKAEISKLYEDKGRSSK
jgi:hypothetical protein